MVARKLVFSSVLLLAGVFCLWRALNPSHVDASPSLRAANVTPAATSPAHQAIETIRVAQRVVGRNPIREEVEPWEPDPQTWREVRLHMRKPSGRSLWMTLLRPFIWLQTNDAAVGDTIDMDLHELGASGPAEVTYIGPCPEIPPGDDPVVIGTFKHEVDENSHVINLWLEGDAQPTGVTDNHPYWSVDRGQFVPAGELRVGETVDTLAGTARVARLESRAYTGFLYNLETTEHVYRVDQSGILVHNNGCSVKIVPDSYGRTHKAFATVTPDSLRAGTRTNRSTTRAARNAGKPGDDAGHIRGWLLGGRGGVRDMNWFAQSPHVNRGDYAKFEQRVARYVKDTGADVNIEVTFEYPRSGANFKRPSRVHYEVFSSEGELIMRESFKN